MKRHGPEEWERDAGPLYRGQPLPRVPDISKGPSTYRDIVAAYLTARRGQWVSGMDLAKIGGAYAWRTRVSDCRTQLGLTIENRVRARLDGVRVSEYRIP